MPMVATMKPYTLFVVDDDMPLNPRTDYDNLGKMVCWHSRYNLGDEHDYDEPRDFLQKKLFEIILPCKPERKRSTRLVFG